MQVTYLYVGIKHYDLFKTCTLGLSDFYPLEEHTGGMCYQMRQGFTYPVCSCP